MTKWVYHFGDDAAQGCADMAALLGGKGACLARLSKLGMPVPPGFTITTQAWAWYHTHDRCWPEGLCDEVRLALRQVGRLTGRHYGGRTRPLLLSVRSGAQVSMPGMMDTVLNLGLNDVTVRALAGEAGARFAYDCYRRFIRMYSTVVLGIDHSVFEDILNTARTAHGCDADSAMTEDDLKNIVISYKACVEEELGHPFPQDVQEQLRAAIEAVFASWMSPRAVTYRNLLAVPGHGGTAVTVQAMVFGNMGGDCATGVAFTRDPSTGENALCGEFLVNAQGEDVVAGLRTPHSIRHKAGERAGCARPLLEKLMPDAFAALKKIAAALESQYCDMQDIEFTIERGKLWILQIRAGKRTTKAALKIAVDLAESGLISREEAVMRIEPASLGRLLHPVVDPLSKRAVIAAGLAASPGAAVGEIIFSADEAVAAAEQARAVILVRTETGTQDIHGMSAAQGFLTIRGGVTSHAAVIARGMGKPCVCGARGICVSPHDGVMKAGGKVFKKGDVITLDGDSGEVLEGRAPLLLPRLSADFARFMQWSDDIRRLQVRANADTPADARQARAFGAEGIGLCRTEQMLFDGVRITAMRALLLSAKGEERRRVLARLLPAQRADFIALFEIMRGFPVTIRLLDLPLRGWMQDKAGKADGGGKSGESGKDAARRLQRYGLAACFPEIVDMQVRAIFEAAIEVAGKTGLPVTPEIMVPPVSGKAELDCVKARVDAVAGAVMRETGCRLAYQVGTMINMRQDGLPVRELAQTAAFFLLDAHGCANAGFLPEGRLAPEKLKVGICGEGGVEPSAIGFCEQTGVDYVSCAPLRVPVLRLAAAQAVLKSFFQGRGNSKGDG